jgi:hypothetical protein
MIPRGHVVLVSVVSNGRQVNIVSRESDFSQQLARHGNGT